MIRERPGGMRVDWSKRSAVSLSFGVFLKGPLAAILVVLSGRIHLACCGGGWGGWCRRGLGLAGERSIDVQAHIAATGIRRARRGLIENPSAGFDALVRGECRHGEQCQRDNPISVPVIHGVFSIIDSDFLRRAPASVIRAFGWDKGRKKRCCHQFAPSPTNARCVV